MLSKTTGFFLSPQIDCMLTYGNENHLHTSAASAAHLMHNSLLIHTASHVLVQLMTAHLQHKHIFTYALSKQNARVSVCRQIENADWCLTHFLCLQFVLWKRNVVLTGNVRDGG